MLDRGVGDGKGRGGVMGILGGESSRGRDLMELRVFVFL